MRSPRNSFRAALIGSAACLVAFLAGAMGGARGPLFALPVVGLLICLCLPLEGLLVLVLIVASGAGTLLGSVGSRYGSLLALVLAAILMLRASGGGLRGSRLVAVCVLAAANLLAIIFAWGYGVGPKQLVQNGTPFLIALFVIATPVTREQARRALQWLWTCSVPLSLLYIVTSLSGAHLVPGIYRMQAASFVGLSVFRTYAPGGLLYAFTFIYALAAWGAGGGKRWAYAMGGLIGLLACALTLSRGVLLGVGVAAAVLLLPNVVATPRGRTTGLVFVVGSLLVAAVLSNPRVAGTTHEVAGQYGDYGSRVHLLAYVVQYPGVKSGLLAGFATPPVDLSDSSLAGLFFAFGVPVSALLLVSYAWFNYVRSAQLLKASDITANLIGLISAGMVALFLVTSFGTDSMESASGLTLLAAVMSFALSSASIEERGSGFAGSAIRASTAAAVAPPC